jgi:signal transduction histidine kinase
MTIGTKLGAVATGLVVVLVVASGLLIAQVNSTSSTYDHLLAHQVEQALTARKLQVEFKKQVQDWKDILLRGQNSIDYGTYSAGFHSEDAAVSNLVTQLLNSGPDPRTRAQLIKFRDGHAQLDLHYAEALVAFDAVQDKDPKVPDRLVRGQDRPLTDLIDVMVGNLETTIHSQAAAQRASAATRHQVTLIIGGLMLVVLIALLGLAVTSVVRPIRRLTSDAFSTATDRLPSAISAIKTMELDAEPPRLPEFQAGSGDELGDLADALNSLQDSALRLAVDQHRADRETADMLINLGRRNQNLLGRMLSYVTDLERQEQNPEVLSQLFRLDHATTRIRRNAESMLVLAGATQTRTWSRPVPVIDVVRAALSEIEEYIRVDLHHLEEAMVNGSAVADVVHLIAELVENATNFSPPTTQVTVIGQRIREGYRLRVIDQGVGMTRRELEDANQRIQRSDGGWSDAKLLGLFVVGRLARRRGIQVHLEPSAGRGITATILLPAGLLGSGDDAGGLPVGAPLAEPTSPSAGGRPGGTPDDEPASVGAGTSNGDAVLDLTRFDADRDALVPAGVPLQWPGEGDPAASGGTPVVAPSAASAPSGGLDLGSRLVEPPPSGPIDPLPVMPIGLHPGPAMPLPTRPARPLPTRPANGSRAPAPAGTVTGSAIPRRVRGAQLPDLGPTDEPTIARPEEGPGAPESLRWQLRSFQLDVQAARRTIAGEDQPAGPQPDNPPLGSPQLEKRHDLQADQGHPDQQHPDQHDQHGRPEGEA